MFENRMHAQINVTLSLCVAVTGGNKGLFYHYTIAIPGHGYGFGSLNTYDGIPT
jgi:hypothetical protein